MVRKVKWAKAWDTDMVGTGKGRKSSPFSVRLFPQDPYSGKGE